MAALTSAYAWHWLKTEVAVEQSHRIFLVEKGQGLAAVAADLKENNLLQWPIIWRAYARFMQPSMLKAGEYQLAPHESPMTLLTRLQGGEVIHYDITFPEGLTLKEWLALMAAEEKLEQKAATLELPVLADTLGIRQDNPEGWFFPDTYRFEKGDSDLDILQRAYAKMKAELAQQWARRMPSLPYRNAYDVLIMSSIIEKETGAPHERREIAGVFVRRLKKKMRLQTDPTVIYGMGDAYNGNIRRSDLRKPTPYNTYVIKGLPPTPIANAGRAALAAAVNPKKGKALYFVAKGDGSHYFSATLDEHNQAVKRYQLKRRKNYRSSPKIVAPAKPAAPEKALTSDSGSE